VKLALSRECYEDDMFEILLVESHNNVDDLMTKVLGGEIARKAFELHYEGSGYAGFRGSVEK
jgi:hypothetical protein